MKVFGGIMFLIGVLLIAGSAGSEDFYEQCKAAVDCVAGDPPSAIGQIIEFAFGLIFSIIGVRMFMFGFDQDS
jgi:ascorbate-specific PTS system EIIC-type component UlaA